MSVALNASEFPIPEQTPSSAPARKGLLSRLFNAAVKAAPTAAASAALGFTLRTAAVSGALAAGASTGVTLAAIAAASGTTAALVTAGKEAWIARKEGRGILETLSSRDLLQKVRNNFALAAGFGALGATVAPMVIDYVKNIDIGAAAEKVANFFIPTAAAFDINPGDTISPHALSPAAAFAAGLEVPSVPTAAANPVVADSAAPSPAAAPESQPLPKEAPNAAPAQQPAPQGQQAPAAPEPARPAPSKGAPVRGETVAEAAQATPAPKASRAEALERARALLSQGGKAPGGLGNIESLSAQHLKDKGVEALWKHKNPALARALFEASGNGQARQALAFMDKHGMGLPKGGASAAMAEAASAPKPATPAPAAAPLEKGPGTGPRVAAKCTMTYPPMEGLTLECEVKNPTMYSGDRIDVVDATNRPDTRGKLTQIFYKAESKLRTLAEAISTNAFLKGRVAPVFVAADPGIQEYIQKGYVTPPNRSDVNLAVK